MGKLLEPAVPGCMFPTACIVEVCWPEGGEGGRDLVSTGSVGCIPNCGNSLQDSIARHLECEDQLVGIHGWELQFRGALA
eukprot:scaffold261994_cov44-Tisochrysis_lutea.AAC.1